MVETYIASVLPTEQVQSVKLTFPNALTRTAEMAERVTPTKAKNFAGKIEIKFTLRPHKNFLR